MKKMLKDANFLMKWGFVITMIDLLNVLVITNNNQEFVGGVENYNKLIYKLFPQVNFFEFSMLQKNNNTSCFKNVKCINDFYKYDYKKYELLRWKKDMEKLSNFFSKFMKDNKIKIILLSGDFFFNKDFFKKYKSSIFFIQHKNAKLYSKNSFTNTLRNLFFYNGKYLSNIENIICFTPNDLKIIAKKTFKKTFFITSPSKYTNGNFKIDKSNFAKEYDFISPVRLEKWKVINIIKIAKKLNDKKFLICGNGEWKDKIKSKNLNNITLLDAQSNEKLYELYKSSKFLFMASKYEGFPLSVSEAISLGVPIICSHCFCGTMVVNSCGLIDKKITAKKIREFISKSDYSSLVKECNNLANSFSIDEFRNKWSEVLTDNID